MTTETTIAISKEYYIFSESWSYKYNVRPGLIDDIIISVNIPGGVYGEFAIVWEEEFGVKGTSVKLSAYDDSWKVLPYVPELFEALAKLGKDPTVKQVVAALDGIGYKDATKRYH